MKHIILHIAILGAVMYYLHSTKKMDEMTLLSISIIGIIMIFVYNNKKCNNCQKSGEHYVVTLTAEPNTNISAYVTYPLTFVGESSNPLMVNGQTDSNGAFKVLINGNNASCASNPDECKVTYMYLKSDGTHSEPISYSFYDKVEHSNEHFTNNPEEKQMMIQQYVEYFENSKSYYDRVIDDLTKTLNATYKSINDITMDARSDPLMTSYYKNTGVMKPKK